MGLTDNIEDLFSNPYVSTLSQTVYENLFGLIESAYAQELHEFIFLNSPSAGRIVIKSTEYGILLEHLLDYFIDREEYELCSEIRDLIYVMNNEEKNETA